MNALLGLAIWCGSGALVGGAIGTWYDRTAAGVLLGTFCGVIGWILLLGAGPRPGAHAGRTHTRRELPPAPTVAIQAPAATPPPSSRVVPEVSRVAS
jgi:hypothetical protein